MYKTDYAYEDDSSVHPYYSEIDGNCLNNGEKNICRSPSVTNDPDEQQVAKKL
jgi:hypothetical protein